MSVLPLVRSRHENGTSPDLRKGFLVFSLWYDSSPCVTTVRMGTLDIWPHCCLRDLPVLRGPSARYPDGHLSLGGGLPGWPFRGFLPTPRGLFLLGDGRYGRPSRPSSGLRRSHFLFVSEGDPPVKVHPKSPKGKNLKLLYFFTYHVSSLVQ
jgi:hypothetical protein